MSLLDEIWSKRDRAHRLRRPREWARYYEVVKRLANSETFTETGCSRWTSTPPSYKEFYMNPRLTLVVSGSSCFLALRW